MSASGPNVVIWPCSKIPYEMSDTHPAKKGILDAMKEVEGKTPISFSVRINEPNYINIICDEEKSNKSPVGMHAGERKVNIKSDAWWALHELCHTAGLIHEQARKDRNSFVYVYDPSDGNNVIVAETIYYSAYDRESVMQYVQKQ